jgi:hypothetical protein
LHRSDPALGHPDSRLLFNPEEQGAKGIVNIPPMTDKIYLDTGFTVV